MFDYCKNHTGVLTCMNWPRTYDKQINIKPMHIKSVPSI